MVRGFLQHCSHQYWLGLTNLLSFIALSLVSIDLATSRREKKSLWKNFGNAKIQNRGSVARSKYAIHCAMRPPPLVTLFAFGAWQNCPNSIPTSPDLSWCRHLTTITQILICLAYYPCSRFTKIINRFLIKLFHFLCSCGLWFFIILVCNSPLVF